jgi:transposase
MAKRAKQNSWPVGELSDDFWQQVAPLIPKRQRETDQKYVRKPGGGRKPTDPRLVFEGIVFVLRTGCPWKALPTERYGSSTIVHRRFCEWQKARVFEMLWAAGLAKHAEMEGIAWRWDIANGAIRKPPPPQEAGGPSSAEREVKRRDRQSVPSNRAWRPAVNQRQRNKPTNPKATQLLIAEDRDLDSGGA